MMKAYIFDLDGTLVDSLASIANCANACLVEAGLPEQKLEDYRYFAGDGQYELIKRALRAAGDTWLEKYDKVMARYIERFRDTCHVGCVAYAGMPEKLAELKQNGKKLAVLSNKAHVNTLKVIEEVYGNGVFDIVMGQKDQVPKKPAPDGVFAIMQELHVTAEECIYVGDTSIDMKTGKAAGIFTVGVTWGFRGRKELEEAGADQIIDRASELIDLTRIPDTECNS